MWLLHKRNNAVLLQTRGGAWGKWWAERGQHTSHTCLLSSKRYRRNRSRRRSITVYPPTEITIPEENNSFSAKGELRRRRTMGPRSTTHIQTHTHRRPTLLLIQFFF